MSTATDPIHASTRRSTPARFGARGGSCPTTRRTSRPPRAAQLYLEPSLPVQDLDRAQWVLAYLDVTPDTPAVRLGSHLWLFDAEASR